MAKFLIIGQGSIGRRHGENLLQMDQEVSYVSKTLNLDFKVYRTVEEALKFQCPDFIVIANETYLHDKTLNHLKDLDYKNTILIEKPIFSNMPKADYASLKVKVLYNLRFHPLIVKTKEFLEDKNALSAYFYAGQYLPTWRPDRKYNETYSAFSAQGGGVARDLSHEIDLAQYLFGSIKNALVLNEKVSELEIDSDDVFSLIAKSNHCPHLSIHLNYLDHIPQRFFIINTVNETLRVDFAKGVLQVNNNLHHFTINRNDSYFSMYKDILFNRGENLCSYKEALRVLELILNHDKKNFE